MLTHFNARKNYISSTFEKLSVSVLCYRTDQIFKNPQQIRDVYITRSHKKYGVKKQNKGSNIWIISGRDRRHVDTHHFIDVSNVDSRPPTANFVPPFNVADPKIKIVLKMNILKIYHWGPLGWWYNFDVPFFLTILKIL